VTLVPLKSLAEVSTPDSWWDGFALIDNVGNIRRRTLEDHHRMIAEIEVTDAVPEPVRQHFENARNVYLHAFFSHRLLMVAELQAHVAAEAALLARRSQKAGAPRRSPGLKRLLQHAIKSGWIRDEGFAIHRRHEEARRAKVDMWNQIDSRFQYASPEDPRQYCKILAESFPSLRNSLAHGSNFFYPTVLGTFQITADLINQLFASNHCAP